ncbi:MULTISPECIES: hypothetical protein [unclassified Colwellia]|uniref:hypothetical protein n=1 Tax=unclassified Colwellia TaxID=196834 RepID=UPI0015F4464C|nr:MULTISPECIES: hypothetical protein [unclassified Colwellia]MBA6234383.1 hypothetical protein [Colwellia sp. MB02u-7]MBA6237551.1 hypothetical protein [Colwellia sp. MB02u-11]MBA6300183.1 hypothetical protein [Colwellia sp. MB3u-22]MBA6312187.1 hypothetical protein [Colwellia sp. MB3u-64]
MTRYTEKDYWEDAQYIKWDKNIFTKIDAPISDIRALCEMVLPDWAAPNINFDHYRLEPDILKIGEDRDDRDIFIDLKSLKVHVGSSNQLVNSSPYKLRKALQSYAIMVEKAIVIDEDSIVENRVETFLVQEFKEKLKKLDPQCLSEGSFWSNSIIRLSSKS